jgi:hypothetical protein
MPKARPGGNRPCRIRFGESGLRKVPDLGVLGRYVTDAEIVF